MDVFLSYNRADAAAVRILDEWLRGQGVRCFLDTRELIGGQPWLPILEEAIGREAAAVVVLCGPHGIGPWQHYEYGLALQRRETEPDFPVVPVLLPGTPNHLFPRGLLGLQTWVSFVAAGTLNDPAEQLRLLAALRRERTDDAAVRATICPYKGLDTFQEEDSRIFFGREAEAAALHGLVLDQGLACLIGASGTGKSSLARAGLLPRLRRRSDAQGALVWDSVVLRTGTAPLEALADAFDPGEAPPGSSAQDEHLERVVGHLRGGRPTMLADMLHRRLDLQDRKTDRLLILLDQAEEMFARPWGLSAEAEQQWRADADQALTLLLEATHAGRAALVATVRSDYFEALQRSPLRDRLRDVLLPTDRLRDLRPVVEGPAALVGLRFTPGLVDRILSDTGDEPGNLPLLEHALKGAWTRRQGNEITPAAYDRTGGVHAAINHTAEAAYADLPTVLRPEAKRLFLRLVRPGERGRHLRVRAPLPESPAQVEVAERLAHPQRRLLFFGVVAGKPVLEVAHEALIRGWPTLLQWVEENRERLAAREAVLDWQRVSPGELIPDGALLARAQALLADPGDVPVDDLAGLIADSEAALCDAAAARAEQTEREAKLAWERAAVAETLVHRTRLAAAALLALAVLAIGAGGWAWWQQGVAERETARAEDEAQAAKAARSVADEQRGEAERQARIADQRREEAERQEAAAERERATAQRAAEDAGQQRVLAEASRALAEERAAEADKERDSAQRAAALAEARRTAAVDFVGGLVRDVMDKLGGDLGARLTTKLAIIDRAEAELRGLEGSAPGEEVRQLRADALLQRAGLLADAHRWEEADAARRSAMDAAEGGMRRAPSAEWLRIRADAHRLAAEAARARGAHREAWAATETAAADAISAAGMRPSGDPRPVEEYASARLILATVAEERGDLDGAVRLLQEVFQALPPEQAVFPEQLRIRSEALFLASSLDFLRGRLISAERNIEEIQQVLRRAYGTNDGRAQIMERLRRTFPRDVQDIFRPTGSSLVERRRAIEELRIVLQLDPTHRGQRLLLASLQVNLAELLSSGGDFAAARYEIDATIAGLRALAAEVTVFEVQNSLADALGRAAGILLAENQQRNGQLALQRIDEALRIRRLAVDAQRQDPVRAEYWMRTALQWAQTLNATGAAAQSLEVATGLRSYVASWLSIQPRHHRLFEIAVDVEALLASLFFAARRSADGVATVRRTIALIDDLGPLGREPAWLLRRASIQLAAAWPIFVQISPTEGLATMQATLETGRMVAAHPEIPIRMRLGLPVLRARYADMMSQVPDAATRRAALAEARAAMADMLAQQGSYADPTDFGADLVRVQYFLSETLAAAGEQAAALRERRTMETRLNALRSTLPADAFVALQQEVRPHRIRPAAPN